MQIFCSSEDKKKILEKLIKYIINDYELSHFDKTIYLNQIPQVLALGCPTMFNKLKGLNTNTIPTLYQTYDTIHSSLKDYNDKTKYVDVKNYNDKTKYVNVELSLLPENGDIMITFYDFFQKNNLLITENINTYYKLSGKLKCFTEDIKEEEIPICGIIQLKHSEDNYWILKVDGAIFGMDLYPINQNFFYLKNNSLYVLITKVEKFKEERSKQDNLTEFEGGKLKAKLKSNNVSKKPIAYQYKEVLGKRMKIYKKPDYRKEYVKYKGELVPLVEYKNLMKHKK